MWIKLSNGEGIVNADKAEYIGVYERFDDKERVTKFRVIANVKLNSYVVATCDNKNDALRLTNDIFRAIDARRDTFKCE